MRPRLRVRCAESTTHQVVPFGSGILPLFARCHLKTNSWEKHGHKDYRAEIVVDEVVLLGQKFEANDAEQADSDCVPVLQAADREASSI